MECTGGRWIIERPFDDIADAALRVAGDDLVNQVASSIAAGGLESNLAQ
jgi:hypothetical protein